MQLFVALTFLIQNNILRTLGPKLSLFKVFLPISLDTKCPIGLKDSRFIETPMSLKPLQMGWYQLETSPNILKHYKLLHEPLRKVVLWRITAMSCEIPCIVFVVTIFKGDGYVKQFEKFPIPMHVLHIFLKWSMTPKFY